MTMYILSLPGDEIEIGIVSKITPYTIDGDKIKKKPSPVSDINSI